MYQDDDVQLQIALELSKKQAEEDSKKQNGNDNSMAVDGPKVHEIKLQLDSIGEHLQKGFKELKDNSLFSDITLELGKEKIPAHRIVLCAWSETFKVMLENDTWKESQQKSLKIQVEEKDNEVFKILLNYMYNGETQVNAEQVIPLLSLANYYAVLPLKESCGQILSDQLNDDNVFYLLDICEKFSVNNLRTECAEYLADNFGELLASDKLNELDPETWAEMLKSDEIQVHNEEEIFNAVIRYVSKFDKEKRIKALDTIIPSIRFPLLSNKFLVELEENPLFEGVPVLKKLIHETYKYKLFPSKNSTLCARPRKGASWFDSTNAPASLRISDDRLTAVNNGNLNTWQTIRVSPSLSQGPRYREFKLNSISMNGFFIGIAPSSLLNGTQGFYPGQYGNSWSYEGSGGHLYYMGSTTFYGGPYRSGDRIGLEVDLDGGKLRFYKNGASLGDVPSFHMKSTDFTNDELFACVTFYSSGDSVTIVPSSGPSVETVDTKEDRNSKRQKR